MSDVLGRVTWREADTGAIATLHADGTWTATIDGEPARLLADSIGLTYPEPTSGGPAAGRPGYAALEGLAKAAGGEMEWLKGDGDGAVTY